MCSYWVSSQYGPSLASLDLLLKFTQAPRGNQAAFIHAALFKQRAFKTHLQGNERQVRRDIKSSLTPNDNPHSFLKCRWYGQRRVVALRFLQDFLFSGPTNMATPHSLYLISSLLLGLCVITALADFTLGPLNVHLMGMEGRTLLAGDKTLEGRTNLQWGKNCLWPSWEAKKFQLKMKRKHTAGLYLESAAPSLFFASFFFFSKKLKETMDVGVFAHTFIFKPPESRPYKSAHCT